ncbi:tigger transposable element-derived protein 6-like [Bactrocera tryoni]|uniref:tigger transposable element-derived protein 6-like n=1 Tax=Bactrocera tryoni TaxID=59916 RepID=UPI001A961933|nr:tigger transposable element-derived protein 6-like [Bactrocera tryoni]
MFYLPANTTSIVQPLDQGIIHTFKAYYRQMIVRKQLLVLEKGNTVEEFKKTFNLLTAIHMIKRACWMVRPETIANIFKKCQFVKESFEVKELSQEADGIVELVNSDEFLHEEYLNFVHCDDKLPCYGESTEMWI